MKSLKVIIVVMMQIFSIVVQGSDDQNSSLGQGTQVAENYAVSRSSSASSSLTNLPLCTEVVSQKDSTENLDDQQVQSDFCEALNRQHKEDCSFFKEVLSDPRWVRTEGGWGYLRKTVSTSDINNMVSTIPLNDIWVGNVSTINHYHWREQSLQGNYCGGFVQGNSDSWIPLTPETMKIKVKDGNQVVLVFGRNNMANVRPLYFEQIKQ